MSETLDSLYMEYLENGQFLHGENNKPQSQRQNNQRVTKLLRTAISQKRLAVVLGAGVSLQCGIPMWKPMVTQLMSRALPADIRNEVKNSKISEIRKIRLLELARKHYRMSLREILYKDTSIPSNSTLNHVAKFSIRLLGKKAISRILTYNFDDLLRERISFLLPKQKLRVLSKTSDYYFDRGCLHIIHPHGHISRDATDDEVLNSQVVFSEPDYHRHFIDQSFWANCVQLTTFSEYSCLFLGVSFDDPNHRRLLDAARRFGNKSKRHVAVLRWNDSNSAKNRIIEMDLASFGINPYWVNSFSEIGTLLKKLS